MGTCAVPLGRGVMALAVFAVCERVRLAITPSRAAQRRYPCKLLQSLAMPVFDETYGQSLQYRQLHKHPKFAQIWNTSYANELGRIRGV